MYFLVYLVNFAIAIKSSQTVSKFNGVFEKKLIFEGTLYQNDSIQFTVSYCLMNDKWSIETLINKMSFYKKLMSIAQ